MPPRRPRDASNTSFGNPRQVSKSDEPAPSPAQAPAPAPASGYRAMSPTSRYNHNLRVVRRRDPTIVAIFEKFDHVCLYHLTSGKWEKAGFEGATFLFEREHEPRYGLYILNRSGPEDYIQYIYPWDDLDLAGPSLLSYRTYPDYTTRRLTRPKSAAESESVEWVDGKPPDPYAEKHRVGTVRNYGFWTMLNDGRNLVKEALIRLHSFVANGERYPDEFRRAPDRPLSTAPHAEFEIPATSVHPTSQAAGATQAIATNQGPRGGQSELDILFSKLAPTPSNGTATTPQVLAGPSSTTPKKMSVDGLFASLGGPSMIPPQAQSRSKQRPSVVSTASTVTAPTDAPVHGLALLNSIFASASEGPAPAPQATFLQQTPTGEMNAAFRFPRPATGAQPTQRSPEILSPKPTTSALPQILNMDRGALSTMLGQPPSRGSSAAGSSSSGPGRYEGDNEDSEGVGASDADYSESGTLLDFDGDDGDGGGGDAPGGARYGRPVPALTGGRGLLAVHEPVMGDVTPRARPLRALTADSSASSITTVRAPAPFEDSSHLWPAGAAGALDMDGVVELDFADTSALSDPAAFSARAKGKQRGRGAASGAPNAAAAEGKGKKKGKKEPVPANGQASGSAPAVVPVEVKTAVVPAGVKAAVAQPVVNGSETANGRQASHRARRSLLVEADDDEPAPSVVNGHGAGGPPPVAAPRPPGAVDQAVVRPALLDALFASQAGLSAKGVNVSQEAFVREVVRMMHTDKAFVDQLWQGYLARSQ